VSDRSHDTNGPERLTLLTPKNWGHNGETYRREALSSGRATEDEILSPLKRDGIAERFLLKWMKLKSLQVPLTNDRERDGRVLKRRDHVVGL
jgi:hypothetical protein